MNRIQCKLRSERGASITFALLIFLVCAMVSVAVVVAGTAAAGRMSQRAETDQRYYAVSSAAELLCHDFKGMTVELGYTKVAGTVPDDPNISITSITKEDGTSMSPGDCGLLTAASTTLVKKIAGSAGEAFGTSTGPDAVFTLSAGDGHAELGCTINEHMQDDGRVIFEVSNTADGANAKKYTLQVIFHPNINSSVSQYKQIVSGVEQTMERVSYTLIWSLNSIEKGAL